jgi:hypothetical protein
MWPGGHHLTNVFFHLANTILLFLFFSRVTGALWPSAMVAALFALHPLHVESVADGLAALRQGKWLQGLGALLHPYNFLSLATLLEGRHWVRG